MKQMTTILIIGLVCVCAYAGLAADERRTDSSPAIKGVLGKALPSLAKVVSENDRRYVATGIALDGDYVLTSTAVLFPHYERIYVENAARDRASAVVSGRDDLSGLALLKLDKRILAPIGTAGQTGVGDWVALIGAFYNQFPSIYQGLVSSVSPDELLLNAPVAPGAPGGAVVNRNGELVGVIRGGFGYALTPDYTYKDHFGGIMIVRSGKVSGSDLCYAVPLAKVRSVAESLRKFGRVRYGWLGVNFAGSSTRIQSVVKGSPAERAGLSPEDVIREIEGRAIQSYRDVVRNIQGKAAGERIKIGIVRKGKPVVVAVKLGELDESRLNRSENDFETPERPLLAPPQLPREPGIPEAPEMSHTLPGLENFVVTFEGGRQLGADVVAITPDLARKFGVKEGAGLMIFRAQAGGAAQRAGLAAGDILVRINGSGIGSGLELRRILSRLKDREAVLVELYRDGSLKKFSIVPDRPSAVNMHLDELNSQFQELREVVVDRARSGEASALRKMQAEKDELSAQLKKQYEQELQKLRAEIEKLKVAQEKKDEENPGRESL